MENIGTMWEILEQRITKIIRMDTLRLPVVIMEILEQKHRLVMHLCQIIHSFHGSVWDMQKSWDMIRQVIIQEIMQMAGIHIPMYLH